MSTLSGANGALLTLIWGLTVARGMGSGGHTSVSTVWKRSSPSSMSSLLGSQSSSVVMVCGAPWGTERPYRKDGSCTGSSVASQLRYTHGFGVVWRGQPGLINGQLASRCFFPRCSEDGRVIRHPEGAELGAGW